MKKHAYAAVAGMFAAFIATGLVGCDDGGGGGGDGGGDTTRTGSDSDVANSNTGLSLVADTGAAIEVPEGGVPETASGEAGEVTFSIERSEEAPPTTPDGVSRVSDVYQFGPEGMTFATPVAVTIPVDGSFDPDSEEIALYRINPSTGEQERYPTTYDAESQTVSAQTYQFSPWFVGTTDQTDLADACFDVTNGARNWRTVYVDMATRSLKYNEQYNWPTPAVLSSIWPGTDSASSSYGSLRNSGQWFLMQGTYDFCVEGQSNGQYYHGFIQDVTNDEPWHRGFDNRCVDLNAGINLSRTGRCEDAPTPTETFGTGELQFTLTWHSNPSVDLDLWVTGPSGEKVYYDNPSSANGGDLDRDNQCSNYEDGKPENIFWDDAPSGQYVVKVDYYDSCGSTSPAVDYTVRVINGGNTSTHNGTISSGGTDTVDTITAQ